MEESSESTIVEVRKEIMVSPTGGNPTLRIAHFLKPSLSSTEKPFPELSFHSTFSDTIKPTSKKLSLQVAFNGWLCPQKNWKTWVDRLHSKYQTIWRKAGIYEAVKGSTCEIQRNKDLIIGLAEKWCSETNTFVFPWGEATITLEDMMVIGGYSVMGSPVFSPLETQELKEIQEKFIEVRRKLTQTKSKKASHYPWMMHFMERESELEHEAFLSLWLSRFVFPGNGLATISKHVFPMAIHLARGTPIAIAPAVLASIYRDLSRLKEKINSLSKLKNGKNDKDGIEVTLWAPLQLIQIWALERFPTLQPKPNIIQYSEQEPRLARWDKVKNLNHGSVKTALDSSAKCFLWRPYTIDVKNWPSFMFYCEKDKWVYLNSDSDHELKLFAHCLRVCELVGIDSIEQYLPHRVAMQFGMDQDLPGWVAHRNDTPLIAWRNYNELMMDTKLYIASRTFKPKVTSRYLDWWRQLTLGKRDSVKAVKQFQKSLSSSKELTHNSTKRMRQMNSSSPRGFPPESHRNHAGDSDPDNKLTVNELWSSNRSHKKFRNQIVNDGSTQSNVPLPVVLTKTAKHTDPLFPPGFVPKYCRDQRRNSDSDDKLTLKELCKSQSMGKNSGNQIVDDGEHLSGTQSDVLGSPIAVNGTAKQIKMRMEAAQNVIDGEVDVRELKTAKKNASEGKTRSPVRKKDGDIDMKESSSPCISESMMVELEARTTALEKAFAKLKAARSGTARADN
ncbi:Serine/threonine-protein phosphatase 7 long form like [Quillaja saponaria]|uniref:Serine/threonine-protein phosphatase 7 long form like n=1 Tax=Quillaja saponaria TaxID=32244 RepID=A0AAD7LMP8_QUISA|nr:Serine/threonine-protein phosphatase 7 long form like [Quillaja saponaria]